MNFGPPPSALCFVWFGVCLFLHPRTREKNGSLYHACSNYFKQHTDTLLGMTGSEFGADNLCKWKGVIFLLCQKLVLSFHFNSNS